MANAYNFNIKEEIYKLSTWERAVVAKRVAIVAVLTIVANLAVTYGWIGVDVENNVLGWVNAALDALGAVAAISITHPAVTPIKDPRNDVGTPLIPVSQVNAIVNNALERERQEQQTPVVEPAKPVTVDDSDDEVVVE